MKIFVTIAALLLASAADMKNLLIPDICPVLIALFCGKPQIAEAAIIMLIWFVSVLFVSIFSLPVPIGAGDAKLFAALTFSFGIRNLAKIFAAASLLSGIAAVICLIVFGFLKVRMPRELPFAPFITAGFAITVLFPFF